MAVSSRNKMKEGKTQTVLKQQHTMGVCSTTNMQWPSA